MVKWSLHTLQMTTVLLAQVGVITQCPLCVLHSEIPSSSCVLPPFPNFTLPEISLVVAEPFKRGSLLQTPQILLSIMTAEQCLQSLVH